MTDAQGPTAGEASSDGRPQRRTVALVLAGALATSALIAMALRRDEPASQPVNTFPSPSLTVLEPGIATNPDLDGTRLPTGIAVSDLEGRSVSLDSLLGAPLVLNFWFSSCAPCRLEMPAFESVHAQIGDTVRFVGINVSDPASIAERFAKQVGVTYDIMVDGRSLSDALRLARMPTTVFVTPAGRITSIQSGELTADELRARIDEELLT